MKSITLKSWLLILLSTLVNAQGNWGLGIEAQQSNAAFSPTPKQLQAVGSALTQIQNSMQDDLRRAAADRRLLQKINQELQQNRIPSQLAPLFLRQISVSQPRGKDLDKIPSFSTLSIADAQFDGGISGRVTVEGQIPNADEIMVYAFNRFGYYAGSAKVSGEDGLYTIANLPSDSFYVLTKSDKYVDELYENVLTPLGSLESWRQAQKVFVPAAIINEINFDLLQGTVISGSILASDDAPVGDGTIVDFTITSDRDSLALFTRQVIISEGRYQFSIPATGRFKVKAEVEGFLPTWAYQQKSWRDGQTLELSDHSTEQNLDFKLLVGAAGAAG
ncbi:MAG: carboxypeptidase regulatory-like domain-containing protein, partial [Calditrichaeota bacterium]